MATKKNTGNPAPKKPAHKITCPSTWLDESSACNRGFIGYEANIALAIVAYEEAGKGFDPRLTSEELRSCPMYRNLVEKMISEYTKLEPDRDPIELLTDFGSRMLAVGAILATSDEDGSFNFQAALYNAPLYGEGDERYVAYVTKNHPEKIAESKDAAARLREAAAREAGPKKVGAK